MIPMSSTTSSQKSVPVTTLDRTVASTTRSLDAGDQARDVEDERGARDRAGHHEIAATFAMGLGEQLGGPDVEEEADEETEDRAEHRTADRQEQGDDGSDDRRRRVDHEPAERRRARRLVREQHAHGADAIREVVEDDDGRDDDPELDARVERRADRDAVEEAVDRHPAGAER